MDSSASSYLLNGYYVGKEDSNIIDLGLSLRALQPEVHYPSAHVLLDWHPQLERSSGLNAGNMKEICDEETDGIQSQQRSNFVKVNMDGLIVGRKICILNHMDYYSLALQLEDMFGRQSTYGLRLFQDESKFTLFYKDKEERWRTVGDVPWKEFVDRVKRLRIARRDKTYGIASSSALLNSV